MSEQSQRGSHWLLALLLVVSQLPHAAGQISGLEIMPREYITMKVYQQADATCMGEHCPSGCAARCAGWPPPGLLR